MGFSPPVAASLTLAHSLQLDCLKVVSFDGVGSLGKSYQNSTVRPSFTEPAAFAALDELYLSVSVREEVES